MRSISGPMEKNLGVIETHLGITLQRRGNTVTLPADQDIAKTVRVLFDTLNLKVKQGFQITEDLIKAHLHDPAAATFDTSPIVISLATRKKAVTPRTQIQRDYMKSLVEGELNFGIGPAGTGKTYLAVAVGVSLLLQGTVDRLIFSRPAVEAGERLGFLPGDMKDKVDPYMQPLYDALNDVLPAKQIQKMLEDKTIEIAPLAFMRGRTFTGAYVLLDEAQNATSTQMKMFLTRLGGGSRMVVTGDVSQVDLPRGTISGLAESERVLRDVKGAHFTRFSSKDVVRHALVARILEAYEADDAS